MLRLNKEGAETPLVSLALAKEWFRVTFTSNEDAIIQDMIEAATTQVEHLTNRSLINQTITLYRDDWADVMELWGGKVQSVTAVRYLDINETQQVLPASYYQVSNVSPWYSAIVRAPQQSWPSIGDGVNPIEIEYVAGYGPAANDVPTALVTAVKMLALQMYENREISGPFEQFIPPAGFESLIAQYRIAAF